MKVIQKQNNSRMCFICGMDNREGLRAQFYTMEDGSVLTPFMYRTEHQSFPQRVHGGLVSTMLDEMGLRAMWAKNSENDFGVTISLSVKFRKPVPYNEPLIGRGIVTRDSAKFITINSELFDRGGILLANAEVKYIRLLPDQIAKDVDPHEEMCYHIADDVSEIIF